MACPRHIVRPPTRGLLLAAAAAAVIGALGCSAPGPADTAASPPPTPAQQRAQAQRDARAQVHFNTALGLKRRGLDDSALAEFGMALEFNPRLTEAYMGMGDIYRGWGSLQLADQRYRQAVELEPDLFDARYYLALTRQLMGRFDEAVTAYQHALILRPNDLRTHLNLASAYLQDGQPEQALTHARRAIELDRSSQPAWINLAANYALLRRFDDAVNAYRTAAELGQMNDRVLLGLAEAHLQLGNFQRAANVLRALSQRVDDPAAQERLGYALFRLRRFEEALVAYNQALELAPEDPAALNGYGATLMTLYLQRGSREHALRDAALDSWRRSVRADPEQDQIIDLLSRYRRPS
jgi:tetratricopeptide (TPR) repeat protein